MNAWEVPAGWWPLIGILAAGAVVIWMVERRPRDPWARYIDRMVKADLELKKGLQRQPGWFR